MSGTDKGSGAPADERETAEGDFGAEKRVSTPTSIGHGRLSVEENKPGSGGASGQPLKDTDASGLVP